MDDMDDASSRRYREALAAAASDDTARRIRDAVVKPIEDAILAQTSPSTLFEIEHRLDAFPHPENPDFAESDHVGPAVHAALRDAVDDAVTQAEFVEAVNRAVMAHPRVREAIDNVTRVAAEVAASETQRLKGKP